MPVLNGHGKGDLFVEVRVQTPGKLNKRQRELLAELGELTPVENKPQRPVAAGAGEGYVCVEAVLSSSVLSSQ